MSRSRANWIVMVEMPWPLSEVIWSMPAIVENCFSSRVALGARDRDLAQFGGHVGLDHEYVLTAWAGLHGSGWHDEGVFLVVERDPDVDELARPQRVFAVLELRPQFDRAGARIDCIVDEDQRSGGGRLGRTGHE